MKVVTIEAVDLPDAWFQCIRAILDHGEKYTIQHGSYVGETRLQLPYVVINIKNAYSEPYDSMLPQIPAHLNIPNPVADKYVEQYMPYLMTDHIKDGELYTYGSRIHDQINHYIDLLKDTPNTNQAVLQVAQPSDKDIVDPPCLRHISMKIINNELRFSTSWRSWDLFCGMPANLAAIAVLQKYMADGIGVKCGPMISASDGLHIYGYAKELARIRAGL